MLQLFFLLTSAYLALGSPVQAQQPNTTNYVTNQDTTGNGLLAEYYNGTNFEVKVHTRVDKDINLRFYRKSPAPNVNPEYYSVRWTGKLFAPVDGRYKIIVHADDGVRLWLGGKLLLDQWYLQQESIYTKEVKLKGNQYHDLKIEYYNGPTITVIKLAWESPENAISLLDWEIYNKTEVIPQKYLFSTPLSLQEKPVVAEKPLKSSKVPVHKPISLAAQQTDLSKKQKPATTSNNVGNKSTDEAAYAQSQETFENLEEGQTIVLKNVLFEQSKYALLPESYAELDKLVRTLQKYSKLQIQIAGHTDNVGDQRLNQILSEQRARVVANYLIKQGIAESRLDVRGYGSSKPISNHIDEATRARNRRVELVIF